MDEPNLIVAALEFASPAMLGWAAAAATPFLINFWIRRRHVETPWAAVELLRAAVRQRSRQIRLREWLLLLMRAAILLLAALAAARPVWTSGGTASEPRGRTHRIIVIDQSASMKCRIAGGTRMEEALARARRVVEEAPAGDAFTVLAWAERADNVLGRPTFDKSRALAAIESVAAVDTVADMAAALRAAATSIDATAKALPDLDRTQIVFITDAAATTWSAALPQPAAALSPVGADETFKLWNALAKNTDLVVEAVDDQPRDNLAIADVTTQPQAPLVNQPLVVNVRLSAFGKRPWQNIPVEVLLDGLRLSEKIINAQPGEDANIQFEARVNTIGNHVVEARFAEDADVLPIDNRRWLSIDVTDVRRVICFADVPEAAEDIARALNPRFREGAAGSAISVDLAATASLASKDLAAYNAVFLCNVADLSNHEQRLLKRYVEDGGALVVVLGPASKPAAFNRFFASAENGSASSDQAFLSIELAEQPAVGDWRLDPLGYRHPIVAPFEGRSRAGLLGVHVSNYFPSKIADEQRVSVALGITSGDPAMVVGDFGLGRVAVMTTNPSLAAGREPWTTLAVSPSFVPLMRELFNFVSTGRQAERLNRLAGESLTLPTHSGNPSSDATASGQWQSPDGAVSPSPPEARRAGVYRYLPLSKSKEESTPSSAASIAVAVNIDPRESDLTTVDIHRLTNKAAGEPPASNSALAGSSDGLHVDRVLLAAAVKLVLLELATAWAFGRGWT
jgi:hypothetical protein